MMTEEPASQLVRRMRHAADPWDRMHICAAPLASRARMSTHDIAADGCDAWNREIESFDAIVEPIAV